MKAKIITSFGRRVAATLALLGGIAAPAEAALLNYNITGQGKFVEWGPTIDFAISFDLDTSTLFVSPWGPLQGNSIAATLGMSPFYSYGPGVIDEIHFWSEADGGGIDLAFLRDGYFEQGLNPGGVAFFSGPLSDPTFLTGTWTDVPDYSLNGWSYTVNVTAVETPDGPDQVPEPAMLSILALGTALVGATRRRRA